jgi:hypothetical protein
MVSEARAVQAGVRAPATFTLRPHQAGGGDADDFLQFRASPGGAMALLPTPLSARMQRDVDTFIGRFRSIPALTANLTMDIFQRTTHG